MILLLDEPTNYLDKNILVANKISYPIMKYFILVSHDIPFLNNVVNIIYHVETAN